MSRESTRPSKSRTASPRDEDPARLAGAPAATAGAGIDPEDAARYIGAFAGELAALAKRSRLDFLGYLLDIVRMEAQRSVRAD